MTKTEEVSKGMARKWERHFTGKWRILGRGLIRAGIIFSLGLAVLWTQIMCASIGPPRVPTLPPPLAASYLKTPSFATPRPARADRPKTIPSCRAISLTARPITLPSA